MFDLLILNGTVIDGTGDQRVVSDIGVRDGKIVDIGRFSYKDAAQVIHAQGLCVTPGFIDLHSHSDFTLMLDGRGESFIRQGVTTEVIGNCGMSAAPLQQPNDLRRNVFCFTDPYTAGWSTMDEYLSELESATLGINVVPLVGHAAIRSFVMGYDRRHASTTEIEKMNAALQHCLESGVWGFSTGLEYFPGISATEEEIHGLCKIVSRYDGIYTTHVKNRDEQYRNGFGEAFETALKTDVRLQISHAVPKYGAPEDAKDWFLSQLNELEHKLDVACDLIPYEWGPTSMTAILPAELLKLTPSKLGKELKERHVRDLVKAQKQPFWLLLRDRCWDKIYLYYSEKFRDLVGKNALELAEALNTSPYDALLDILAEEGENMFSVLMMGKIKRSGDLVDILKSRFSGVISDGLSLSDNGPLKEFTWSPGCYGWVPRFLGKFAGNGKPLNLEEGVEKITGFAAKRLGLKKRGLLKRGYWADIVIFDHEKLEEKASLFQPAVYPKGIRYVVLNGEIVVSDEKYQNNKCGKLLRKTTSD